MAACPQMPYTTCWNKAILPELLTDDLICQGSTQGDRAADAHFLLRYMRRENY